MSRLRTAAGLALAASTILGCGGAPRSPSAGARVVLITLDTTRADRLGAYGSTEGLTPNLDGLAARGAVFEQAIAQASVTPVSHASILTGLDPYSHGLRVLHGTSHNRLAPAHTTLAEVLRDNGYATAAFISAFPAGSHFGLDQGFDLFDEDFGESNAISPAGVVNTGGNQRRANATTDRALAWANTASEPFFLWVHYFDPHDPQVLPPDEFLAGRRQPEGDEASQLRTMYDHEVAFLDQEIGRLLDSLGPGVGAEPLVAVVADHGEGLGDHSWWTHGVLYQEQIRVPLILAGPGVPSGKRIPTRVRTTDLAPTLLDLLSVSPPDGARFDGLSLRPLLDGSAPSEHRSAYADSLSTITYRFTPTLTDRKDDILFATFEGRWKYIHHYRHPEQSELYDLEEDPLEADNLLEARPGIAERLRRSLVSKPVLPASTEPRQPSAADEEAERRLRALGYVD